MNFKIKYFGEELHNHDNVDIEIELSNGEKYSATFFTMKNIELIFKSYKESGECANGTYFWASNMIIVNELNMSTIKRTIEQLIKDDEFDKVCSKI